MKILQSIQLALILFCPVFAQSANDHIQDQWGAYFYDYEITNIISNAYKAGRQDMAEEFKTYKNSLDNSVSNMVLKYENKISLLDQKHELELYSTKLKYQLKNSGLFWLGFGAGAGITGGGIFLLSSVQLPIISVKF